MNAVGKVIGMGRVIEVFSNGLAAQAWNDNSITELGASLDHINILESYRNACLGERQRYNRYMRQLAHEGLSRKQWWPYVGPKWARPLWAFYPRGWVYRNQLIANRFFDKREQSINLADGTFNLSEAFQPDTSKANPVIDAFWLLAVENGWQFSSWFLYAELGVRLASTASALERYRLERGEYPESLDVLLQRNFLRSLPRSPSDGSPLQYGRDGSNSYILSGTYTELEQIGLGPITKRTEVKVWKPAPH